MRRDLLRRHRSSRSLSRRRRWWRSSQHHTLRNIHSSSTKKLMDRRLVQPCRVKFHPNGLCGLIEHDPAHSIDLANSGNGQRSRLSRSYPVAIHNIKLGHTPMIAADASLCRSSANESGLKFPIVWESEVNKRSPKGRPAFVLATLGTASKAECDPSLRERRRQLRHSPKTRREGNRSIRPRIFLAPPTRGNGRSPQRWRVETEGSPCANALRVPGDK
jgi:hypothetical protein